MRRERASSRGAALVGVAIFLAVILGFTAIGIDIARLAHVATEVQTVADAAARGGATRLAETGGDPGEGIARAQEIAALNVMNAHLAEDELEVLIDEGHYNEVTQQFECCTSNTPCCEDGSWGDLTCTGSDSCDARTAVLASPHTDVNNLFAGVFDFISGGKIANAATEPSYKISRVEKIAVASPQGPGGACQAPPECAGQETNWQCWCDNGVAPCLPITAPECEFPPACSGLECQLPDLTVTSSNGDETASWWSTEPNPNAPILRSYLNQGPCDAPGTDRVIDSQDVGNSINVNNGLDGAAPDQLFGLVQCLAGQGDPPRDQPQGCAMDENGNIIPGQRGTIFTIPIIDKTDCDAPFVQSYDVIGFATISIEFVSLDNPRTINITTLANRTATNQQLGGGCFGTDCRIVMTR